MQTSKEIQKIIVEIGLKHNRSFWSAVPQKLDEFGEAPVSHKEDGPDIRQIVSPPGTTLRAELTLGGDTYYPLVIEVLTPQTLRVAHETTGEGGEVVKDPEVVFYCGFSQWIAMELSQPSSLITSIGLPETNQKSVYLMEDGQAQAIKSYDPVGQKNIALFVKVWARQLKDANWPELSTDADDYQQASFNERGEVLGLVREMDRQARRDNVSVTVSSGGRSATIGQPQ